MSDRVSIIEALDDPALFGSWFRDRDSWHAWRVFLAALFGLQMSADDAARFAQHTGRERAPTMQAREAWLVVGRRGGKSFIVALVAVFLACFRDYRAYLAPGERGVVMVLAADRKQARVVFRYVRALLQGVPMLAKLIVAERAESIELSSRIDIEIHTASFRAVRGYTVVAALADEIAFWQSEDSANPDREIVAALRPAMATVPNALLIALSSPYARRGVLWEAYRDHYGRADDNALVWQAESRAMNPALPQLVVDRAYADDPIAAAAEYGAQFRSDVEGFLLDEWLDRAVDGGVAERAPLPGVSYHAFADPSGGGADSFTLAIAHQETDGHLVLDVCRGRTPPFEPRIVVEEFAGVLKRYGLARVRGDRYAAEWPVEAFRNFGILYEPAAKTKSELYLEAEPLFAQGAVRLLDQRRLLNELRQLERHTGNTGRDRVDHPPRGHDDHANAACGALVLVAAARGKTVDLEGAFVPDPELRRRAVAAHMRRLEIRATTPGFMPWDF